MQIQYQETENYLRSVLNRSFLRWRPHFHSSLEVVYLRSGSSTLLVDGTEYHLRADDLAVIFPQQIHSYRDDVSPDCMVMFIPLDYTTVFREQLCQSLPTDPILHEASRFPYILELFAHIRHAKHHPGTHENEVCCGYLAAFIGLLLDHIPLKTTRDIELSAIHTVLRYCAAHFSEPLTISTLSDELHLHRSYLSSIFSHQLQIGFNEYLNSIRVEEACRRLRSTDDMITDIALSVGFDNTRTFNRAFQRVCGKTPSEYRKSYNAK